MRGAVAKRIRSLAKRMPKPSPVPVNLPYIVNEAKLVVNNLKRAYYRAKQRGEFKKR